MCAPWRDASLREEVLAGGRLLIWGGLVAALALLGLWGTAAEARAQQKIGYVDTQAILEKLPEYATVQQKLDQLEKKWRSEIQTQKKKVQKLKDE